MKLSHLNLPIALFLILIISCNRNKVELVNFTAPDSTGEVARFTSFEFAFDEDLAPDTLIGNWHQASYVRFEPAIPGKFRWQSPSLLSFSPETPLLASQEYTATVTDSILFSKDGISLDIEPVKFHTAYFGAEKIEFFHSGIANSNYKVSAKLNIHFNYDVDPSAIREYLQIERGGQAVEGFKIISDQVSKIIAIDLGEQQQVETDQDFKVTVLSGLPSAIKGIAARENSAFQTTLPALAKLAITSVTAGLEGESGWIEVFTTQKVSEESIRKFVVLDPRVEYNVVTDENRFRLSGSFEPGMLIKLSIAKGMPGLYGGTLSNEYFQEVAVADLDPSLKFAGQKGRYLMRSGLKNLQVLATNVAEVEVEYYQVFANNLLFFLYNNDYSYDYYDEYYYDDYYSRSNYVGNFGQLLHTDTVIIGSSENLSGTFNLNVADHIDRKYNGAFVVQVRDMNERWRTDSRIILVSDIGMIARKSRDELLVFCNELSSTLPLAGVEISLISSNNQTLATAMTDASGVARLAGLTEKTKDFDPRLITALRGQDFNYLDLDRSGIETSRFDAGGREEPHETYDTYIYSERNLYRPGETGHISGFVRDRGMEIVKDIPVILKVIDSRGRTAFDFSKKLDAQGAFEQEFSLSTTAATGEWVAELYTGSRDLLESYRFSVEEFVPDKIRVIHKVEKEVVKPGMPVKISVDAEYLFGAPAAEHVCEIDLVMTHETYSSEKYPEFYFVNNTYNESFGNSFYSITLDAEGAGNLQHDLPAKISASGKISGKAYISVFDATGRTVNRTADFTVDPRSYYLGMQMKETYYGSGDYAETEIVSVSGDDKDLKNFNVTVQVIRFEWRTVLRKNSSGQYRYASEYVEIIEEKDKAITLVGGIAKFRHRIDESGSYEIRVMKKGEDDYVKQTFYAWGKSDASQTSFEVDREGKVEISFDKKAYQPGEKVVALLTTPFSGKMLITIERNKVFTHMYVDVEENSKTISIPVSELHIPNAYVTATLIRKHTAESPVPFFVAHGFASFSVEKPSNHLRLKINSPAKVKPKTTQNVTVFTGIAEKDVYVTVALVDEGILQIKDFKSPDPYTYMYAKRRLSVLPYDIYDMLLPEIGSSSPAGGDDGEGKRLNPIGAGRFKLLSWWSGIRRSNSEGYVTVGVEIPQFNGEARIMAVAYKGRKMGAAEAVMKISDDVVMMPSLPRVLSVADTADVPVTLMNTTTKSGTVKVTLTAEGPAKVISAASQSVSMTSSSTKSVTFRIAASDAPGIVKLKFQVSGLDNVSDEVEMAVRPASPLYVVDGSGTIEARKTQQLDIPAGFLPSSQHTSVTISRFPAVKLAKHLQYVVGYPHGCLEQTVSKAFPQLYFDDLAAAVSPDARFSGNPVYFVNEAITKLRGMQRSDGSFSYWPGSYEGNWWGTAFAAHFLVEAKKAGFVVSQDMMKDLISFLKSEAANKGTYTYEYWVNNSWVGEMKVRREVIYSLYVLALAGEPELSLMNYYRARQNLLTSDSRVLLAGAFALANDWAAFHSIMPGSLLTASPKRLSGGSFDSEIQANAIMLNVLMDVSPDHPQVSQLVRHLDRLIGAWQSTQDRVWGFLAMGKAAKRSANSAVTVEIIAGGKVLKTYTPQMSTLKFSSDQMNGKAVSLKAAGEGELYYYWNTEGIKATAHPDIAEVDQNLKVRREYYDRNGSLISGNVFTRGDLIVCKLILTGGMQSVENVVISDLVPAGFEIENPRLNTSASLSWISNTLYPDYLDVRDDRLLIFTDAYMNDSRTYHYMLRAVNAGTFRQAPVSAEAMYDQAYRSYNGGGTVRVKAAGSGGV